MALISTNSVDDVLEGPVAWINGRFIPAGTAALPVSDLGLHGIAVTEMMRTYDHKLFRPTDHLSRLQSSAQAAMIEADTEGLHEICHAVAMRNASFASAASDLGLVAFVTAGGNPTYLGEAPAPPTVCIHTFELPLKRWKHAIQEGVCLLIPDVRQLPKECVPATVKSRSRLHWHLASREAALKNPKAQPILLDAAGDLTETPSGNFFATFGESVVTPHENVLPGVSRRVVRELSRILGLQYEERSLKPQDIAAADEAFISSTPYGLLPVTEFAGATVGNGRPGPVFFELCNAWSELVGIDIIEQITECAS